MRFHAVPLQSWGNTFSYSIWYVQLFGEGDPSVVTEALTSYNAVSLHHFYLALCMTMCFV